MSDHPDFKPDYVIPEKRKTFKYWVQSVLPIVYDDSLSYMELLNKVVVYLNNTITDVNTLTEEFTDLTNAFSALQDYILSKYDTLEAFVNDYFDNLDVQEEINNKLDQMVEDGTLDELIQPYMAEYANDLRVLEARMDTFASLPDGSTAGDAELLDIRVGADGTTYPSAGDAVRGQVGDINTVLDYITEVDTVLIDGFIGVGNGQINPPAADAQKTTDFIPVLPDETVKSVVVYNTAHYRAIHIYGYDNNKLYLGRLAYLEGGSYTKVVITHTITNVDVRYIRITFSGYNDYSDFNIYSYINSTEYLDKTNSELHVLEDAVISKVDGTTGKNLYDVTGIHSNIIKGYYRSYTSGAWTANVDYEVVVMPVTAGEHYAINTNNTHVCFYSDSEANTYISGFLVNAANGYTFEIPENAVTMSLSFAISSENAFMIEKGTSVSAYAPFIWGVSADSIIGAINNILYVGPGHEYTTIQSAINAAVDGDTIIIEAGTYNESLDMVGKNLHLIGAGKNATIVTCPGDDYYYPALEASKGLIENMAFITTATQMAEGAIDTAYAVHIDYDDEIGNALQFINCHFESPIRPTVGIGLRENFTLNFTDCTFKSSVYPVYCHEQQANNKTGQRIELINCSIQSISATSAIHLQESRAYSGNEVTVLMQRCIAKANGVSGSGIISAVTYPGNQPPTGSHYLNTDSFYLDAMSDLNNENILNA